MGPYKGSTAAEADVTDPRGVATTDANDYETKVQFNWAGLPIEISGPADQNGYWPITTQVWDSNNNLICQRSPAANAYNLACTVGTTTQGPLNTVYSYATDPPYRLLSVNYPTPDTAGQLPNNFENYTYDGGNTFPGLWEETFSNNNMSGLPAAEKMWPNATLLNDWGTGSPAGVSNIDNWSVRLTGLLHIDTTHTYHFRLYSDDGAALTVSDTTLVDCFGQANVFANYNCNSGHDATKKLWPGDKAITIEFSELTGSAKIELQWDQGTGAPMTDVPSSVLSPNLGLMTQEDGPKLRTTWTYPDDDAKSRRLPASMTLHALWDSSLVDRTITYTYDDYGRKLTQITASGSANPETTTYAYTNDPTCMTSVTDPAGGVTNYTCDEAGDVTQVSRVIRAVVAQPAQTRMVTKTYNAEGLVASVTLPANQTGTPNVQNTYDKAGRIKETDRLIKLDDLGNPVLAVTKYTYDDEGRLVTKTLPDPDGSGPIAAPVYSYAYDGADNQTQVTDPLGYVTNTDYDALNRPFQVTSPTGLVSTTNYKLVQAGTFYNQQNVTDPAGVKTVTQLDILGEKTSVQVGSSPTTYTTTYAYDAVGNVTSVTDPAGITVSKTWDAFGELTQKTRPFTATQNAITTYTYDNRGFLSSVDGPRTDVNDKLVYGHDDVGRITSAQFVDWPSGITVVYDDTGEKVKVVQPLNGAVNHIRNWTYDVNGRMVSSTDGVSGTPATTTYGYNQAGWLKWVGDPRNYSLCYVYDNAGERTERYGVAGTNPSSDCSLTSPTKLSDESFQYDLDEEMTQASEGSPTPTSTTSITWDKEGRVKTVAQTGPGASTTTYNYLVGTTVTSQLQSLSVAIGANTYTTSYRYDPATGDLSSMTDPFSGGTTTYGYDGAGRPSTRTDPDGLQWTRTYDQYSGRLSFQSIKTTPTPPTNPTVRASETLTYDIAGEVIQKEEHVGSNPDNTDAANNQPWHYTYDAAGRMITAVGPRSVTTTYGYDNSGDRTSVQVGQTGTQVTTSYDAYGRPSSTSDNATFTSDQVGNLLSVTGSGASGYGAFAYGYDLWGRLTASCPSGTPGAACPVGGANTIAYGSDALDRTVSRKVGTANPATTAYVGETQDPAQVVDSSTTPATTTTYEYDPGGPFSLQQGTTVSYVLSDLHSDVVALAASDGTLPSTFSYDPWGIPKSQTGSGTTYMASVGSLGFQGDPTDPTTALVDMGARSYDANMGEFTQLDTVFGKLKHPLSLNQYVYATDDPISHVDPDGLCSQPDVCPPLPFVQKSGTASQAYSSEVPQREPDPSASAPFAPTTALAPDISVRDPVGTYFRPGLEGTLWSDPAYDKLSENDSPWADQLQPVPSGTIGFCVGASIDLLFFHLGGSVCVQISTSGAIGGTATWGSGLSSQPLGASIGFSLQGSTASHIQDLGGPFTEVGVAGPYRGPTVGVNGFTGQSCGQTVRGADFTFGYSQGLLSGEGSYSHTHTATLGDHDPACPSG